MLGIRGEIGFGEQRAGHGQSGGEVGFSGCLISVFLQVAAEAQESLGRNGRS